MLKTIDRRHSILYEGFEPSIVETFTGKVVPHDEPVFLLRAGDKFAQATLLYFSELCRMDGRSVEEMKGLYAATNAFRDFTERKR